MGSMARLYICRAVQQFQIKTPGGAQALYLFSCLLLPATSLATHVASLQQVRQLWPAGRHCLVTFRAPCPLSNLSHIRVRCSISTLPPHNSVPQLHGSTGSFPGPHPQEKTTTAGTRCARWQLMLLPAWVQAGVFHEMSHL